MSLNDKDQKSSDDSSNGAASGGTASGGILKSLFTSIIYVFAFLAAIVIKPAQALTKEAYEKSSFGTFALVVGVLFSVVGSIGTGYYAWHAGAALQWWLSGAVLALPVVFYYVWPIAYLAVGKWAFKFSSFLWDNVANPSFRSSRSDDPTWLSFVLSAVTTIAVIGGGLALWWKIAVGIHDFLGWNNFFAWAFGAVGGGVLAWAAGMAVLTVLFQAGMPVVAALSGAALTYYFGIDISTYLPSVHWLNPSFVRHGGEALQFAVYVAYVFPLAHIIVSRMFSWVGKYFGRLLKATYDDRDSTYLAFLGQALTLGLSACAGFQALGYAAQFGFGLWLSVPASAVAVLVAYLIGGAVFGRWSNRFVGIVASIASAYVAFNYASLLLAGGVVVAAAAAAIAAFATAILVYPALYQLVKLLANPLLASWLSKPLSQLYKTISSEVFSALDKTYEDKTAYAPFFLQVLNIATAVAVYKLVTELGVVIHLAGWSALVLPVLLTISSYLFLGRLFIAYGTKLIGTLAAIGVGAFVGVEVFAHFGHNLWWAVPSFIGGALLFGLAVFPVTYVVLRAGLELVAVSKWAAPALTTVYLFFFGFVQKFWNEFVRIYRRIAISFAPIWASVSQTWDEAWESAKAAFDRKKK